MMTSKETTLCILSSSLLLSGMTFHECSQERFIKSEIKRHCKREVVINQLSHLTKDLRYLLAEMAMYNADRFFDFNMVPDAIFLRYTAQGKERITFCSQWIESSDEGICNSHHLQHLITPKEWMHMNIFHFLFGQYDRHFGNIVIEKNSGKLYLIDNEAVANVDQFVWAYSSDKKLSCPWVGGVGDCEPARKIPWHECSSFSEALSQDQDPLIIHEAFPHVDEWTKRDIDHGYCRVWNNKLWRQFYACGSDALAAPFCNEISHELLQKLQSLTAQKLALLWPAIPFQAPESVTHEYEELITQFVIKTLERRDMIVDYFRMHPESIKNQ